MDHEMELKICQVPAEIDPSTEWNRLQGLFRKAADYKKQDTGRVPKLQGSPISKQFRVVLPKSQVQEHNPNSQSLETQIQISKQIKRGETGIKDEKYRQNK